MEEITTITTKGAPATDGTILSIPQIKNVKPAKVIFKGPLKGITLAVPVPEQNIDFSVDQADISVVMMENESLKEAIKEKDAEIRRLKSDLAELKVEARRKAKG